MSVRLVESDNTIVVPRPNKEMKHNIIIRIDFFTIGIKSVFI